MNNNWFDIYIYIKLEFSPFSFCMFQINTFNYHLKFDVNEKVFKSTPFDFDSST